MEGLKTPHQVRMIGMAHTTTTTIITERKEREKEKQNYLPGPLTISLVYLSRK